MKLDVEITQSSYWKGGQVPYWLYMVFVIVPFTGLFGVDHMLLRSPLTAILKFLSIIPLFGFWYFYDMAQLGERELIEKNGIGIPFYGPMGIGAGIFTGTGQPISPPDIARPWTFIGYVITSLLFIALPVNKLIIGDYWGALIQFCMYIISPLTLGLLLLPAIGWGLYDIYRILFNTKELFEKGAARIFPASFAIGEYFNRGAMGPEGHDTSNDSWFKRLFSAAIEVPIVGLGAVSSVAKVADNAVIGAAEETVKGAKDTVTAATGAVTDVVDASSTVISESAKAAEKTTSLLAKLPDIAEKITDGLSNPEVLMAAAKAQAGGAIMNPSNTTVIVLFSVALLAFGGYTMYALRKTVKSEEKDDSPPDAATVRGTSKA